MGGERQMRIAITGAAGFVGQAVVAALAGSGASIVATDRTLDGLPNGVVPIAGDLGDPAVRAALLGDRVDALIHLATVPGGAAEADPAESRRINVDAMYDLLLEASALSPGLRVVFASSIAVFGDPMPDHVDDQTPLAPKLIYGGHKAMMEAAVALFSQRGLINGVSLRLPGVLARPQGPSGLKSAFLSDLFHALRSGRNFTCPVAAEGTIWAQSVSCAAANLVHAARFDTALLPPTRAVTLPALRISVGDLVSEVARQCAVAPVLVRHEPDPALQATFATQPPLTTPAADRAGFVHDGDLAALVTAALARLR